MDRSVLILLALLFLTLLVGMVTFTYLERQSQLQQVEQPL